MAGLGRAAFRWPRSACWSRLVSWSPTHPPSDGHHVVLDRIATPWLRFAAMSDEERLQRRLLGLQVRTWLVGVVVLIVGVLIGLFAARAKLPEHFWDGFGGAVLGGLFVAGGGYLGTRSIRALDIKRAKEQAVRNYRAAVVVVLDELQANRAVANNLRQGPHYVTDPTSVGLSEASYLQVQDSLADKLPDRAHTALANAYAEIRARDTLFDPLAYQPVGGGGSWYVRAARPRGLERLHDAISQAITALESERESWTPTGHREAQHGLRWPWNHRP